MLITILVSLPFGIMSAHYKNKWIDQIVRFFSFLGISIPSFWLGLMLMYIFSVKFKLLPIIGGDGIKSLILPSITLSAWLISVYVRRIRTCILEEINKDYVVGLKSKGISYFTEFFTDNNNNVWNVNRGNTRRNDNHRNSIRISRFR